MYPLSNALIFLCLLSRALAQSPTSKPSSKTSSGDAAVTTVTASAEAPYRGGGAGGPPPWVGLAIAQYQESLRQNSNNASQPTTSIPDPASDIASTITSIVSAEPTGDSISAAQAAQSSSSSTTPKGGLSPTQIGLIVLGVSLAWILVGLAVYWILRRRRSRQIKARSSMGDATTLQSGSPVQQTSYEVESPVAKGPRQELWDTQRTEMKGSWPLHNELPT
ncbi:MAG: hypothetical protein Q9174_005573 [Haloplaca sp. 1 TL-2023]